MKVLQSLDDPELITMLQNGAVGILPTDTVYGLVCAAANPTAVERLYRVKAREHKPGTLIAADIDQLVALDLKRRYVKAVEQFWPGPVSVIIPCGEELTYLHQGAQGLAVRLPAEEKLIKLLRQSGPLLTTSANQPGEPIANTLAEAQAYFDDDVDCYVDGGDLSNRAPSTILRITDDAIEVIREGAVHIDAAGRIEA